MRKLLGLFLLFTLSFKALAGPQLSNQAKISLLTCSPGDQLYTLYGHSAIRVNDPVVGFDLVFNYGTFDFDTPNFYLKFGKGDLNYWLNYYSFKRFVASYSYYQQSVTEQEINLTTREKQRLLDALLENAEEANKYYRYDFFFDNCATRIRDIILDNVDGDVVYTNQADNGLTFRALLHQYQSHVPWISDGLDIILGLKTDDLADRSNQMFLPDYMKSHFANAQINNRGESRPLLLETQTVISFDKQTDDEQISPSRVVWFLLIVSLFIGFVEIKKRKKPMVFINRILLTLTGSVGCLIFFLWFLSRHSVTGDNFNMLWAMPFNLFLAFLPAWFFKSKAFKVYLAFSIISVALAVIFFWSIPQYLPPVVLPLSLLILSRFIIWWYLLVKK